MRHPILLWEDWEVMLIAWESGQITPIHDHRGVLGGMAVLSGSLRRGAVHDARTTGPSSPTTASRPEGDLSRDRPDAFCTA